MAPPWNRRWCNVNAGSIQCFAEEISSMAEYLSGMLQAPVGDQTNLTGNYDFDLRWARHPNVDTASPSLFTALKEQLGLRLETTKGTVETIVIDHVERPSAN